MLDCLATHTAEALDKLLKNMVCGVFSLFSTKGGTSIIGVAQKQGVIHAKGWWAEAAILKDQTRTCDSYQD